MSENNHFEIAIQQKMDGFLVEPASSDWQAIYDRLHPRNKRRVIWWWFPLIAALGAGIYWISVENDMSTATVSSQINKTEAAKPIPGTNETNEKTAADQKEPAKTNASGETGTKEPTKINTTAGTETTKPAKTKTAGETEIGTSSKNDRINRDNDLTATSTSQHISSTRQKEKQRGKKQPGPVQQSGAVIPTRSSGNDQSVRSKKEQLTPSPAKGKTEVQQQPANNQSLPSTENIAQVSTAQPHKTAGDSIEVVPKMDSGKLSTNAGLPAKETTTIPVKNKDRNWRLAAYLGTGPNYASEPIQMLGSTMSADLSSAPINNSSGSRTYSNTTEKGGWHFAGGIAVEKNMGKNWLFMTGLGINTSTWKVMIENYKDSLSFGSITSTYKISTQENKNRLWMAEVPLQFSNRIAGKKTGSLWWTIGINNQFRLKFTQQSVIDSIPGTSMADARVMTSSARFYQPQLRLGLMYNHNGKVHWQLQPLFQYTFTGVYATGGSSDVLTNLQLQYRLFLQGKGKGKKSSK